MLDTTGELHAGTHKDYDSVHKACISRNQIVPLNGGWRVGQKIPPQPRSYKHLIVIERQYFLMVWPMVSQSYNGAGPVLKRRYAAHKHIHTLRRRKKKSRRRGRRGRTERRGEAGGRVLR